MAVSNSRCFLQSANSARAYILDNNGRTITEASGHTVLTRQVQNNTQKNSVYPSWRIFSTDRLLYCFIATD
jgi:hypothetical protein